MSGQRIGRATSSPSTSPSPSSPSGPSHTAESSSSPSQTTKSTDVPRGASQDPQRLKHLETISRLREEFQVRTLFYPFNSVYWPLMEPFVHSTPSNCQKRFL